MEKDSKAHIIEVALGLFGEQGMNHVSLNQVIKASGLSKGAFYHHFSSKQELTIACVTFFWEDMTKQIINAPFENMPLKEVLYFLNSKTKEILDQVDQDKNNNLFELYISMLFYVRKEPEVIDIPKGYFESFAGKLVKCIQNDQKRGVLREDIPAEDSALLIAAAVEGHGIYTFTKILPSDDSLEKILNQIYNSLLK